MDKNMSFHDAEVTGLFYESAKAALFIQLKLENQSKISLKFNNVAGWDLSPFEHQNILFDIHEFNKENIPEWIKRDFEIPNQYLALIDANKSNLYYIEPSVGLGGYIVAQQMQITT